MEERLHSECPTITVSKWSVEKWLQSECPATAAKFLCSALFCIVAAWDARMLNFRECGFLECPVKAKWLRGLKNVPPWPNAHVASENAQTEVLCEWAPGYAHQNSGSVAWAMPPS